MELLEAIAQNARLLVSDNPAWIEAAEERQERIVNLLPSGSGFDSGTKLESATNKKIVFSTSFHHMDENGYYCGWTDHKVVVQADFVGGFDLTVSGRNRNNIKEYIADTFCNMLNSDFEWIKG